MGGQLAAATSRVGGTKTDALATSGSVAAKLVVSGPAGLVVVSLSFRPPVTSHPSPFPFSPARPTSQPAASQT
jgi:hypothetical protein